VPEWFAVITEVNFAKQIALWHGMIRPQFRS
jgi:hypothetical protein